VRENKCEGVRMRELLCVCVSVREREESGEGERKKRMEEGGEGGR